jgi:hypothetical protein
MKTIFIISLIFSLSILNSYADGGSEFCKKKKNQKKEIIETNINGKGYNIELSFTKGKGHNNPSFAIWIETMEEKFIQELFVTKSVATGIYRYGDSSKGKWEAGKKMYNATLPYFIHKRTKNAEIPTTENPIIDAYTGATPQSSFILKTNTNTKINKKFRLLIEINQAWDSNNFWHNAKYPDEKEYRNSCQPSLIYAVTIDPDNLMDEYTLNPIGHGHYSGKTGILYTDISTFTTALKIAKSIKLKVND